MNEGIAKAKEFYNQGLRFLKCAERCMGEVQEDGSILIIGGKYPCLSAPTMVNMAFSCECFLKSILIIYGVQYKKVHGLKELYDLLPGKELKEYLQVGEDFEKELEKHSLDFVAWRYYIEEPGDYAMSPMFTDILMRNLNILAKRVISDYIG